jgi:hypothetical protein
VSEIAFHPCPWPSCGRRISQLHWGCIEHWNALPNNLRIELRKAESRRDPDDTTAAKAAIAKWIDENGNQADQQRAINLCVSAGNDVDFAAGVTDDGRVFMIWPRRGEFSTLTKDESALLVKAIRAMLPVTA